MLVGDSIDEVLITTPLVGAPKLTRLTLSLRNGQDGRIHRPDPRPVRFRIAYLRGGCAVPSGRWLEWEGGVISGLFHKP
jgi:hypothetical protein